MFTLLLFWNIGWTVKVVDVDAGRHVALLEGRNGSTHAAVALEQAIPFGFKEGDTIWVGVRMECMQARALDEASSDLYNQWISYSKLICNGTLITQ